MRHRAEADPEFLLPEAQTQSQRSFPGWSPRRAHGMAHSRHDSGDLRFRTSVQVQRPSTIAQFFVQA